MLNEQFIQFVQGLLEKGWEDSALSKDKDVEK